MTHKTQIIVEGGPDCFICYRANAEGNGPLDEDGPFGFGDTPEEAKDDLLKLESEQ